jgi:hypothetical protein
MHERRQSDDASVLPVLGTLDDRYRAKQFRQHLRKADVRRPRLFAETATLLPVNFRSLTGLGHSAGPIGPRRRAHAAPGWPRDHLDHPRLREAGGDLTGRVGEPFGALPETLLGATHDRHASGENLERVVEPLLFS